MAPRNFLAIGAFFLLLPAMAQARPIDIPSSQGLEYMAPIVGNGLVLSVRDSGMKIDSEYDNTNPSIFHELVMIARIRMLHLFKGMAPVEIDFRYRVTAPLGTEMGDGPMHVRLEIGQRYHFFLQPDSVGKDYVDVLDGHIDDNFAVQKLCPSEKDDSPYLHSDNAIRIARDYVHSAILDQNLTAMHPTVHLLDPENQKGALSSVIFWNYKLHAKSIGVVIRDDGSVDRKMSNL